MPPRAGCRWRLRGLIIIGCRWRPWLGTDGLAGLWLMGRDCENVRFWEMLMRPGKSRVLVRCSGGAREVLGRCFWEVLGRSGMGKMFTS